MAVPMRIRAQMQGNVAIVKVLISHPMETGRRKDGNGRLVPAHYIQTLSATLNGKPVFATEWGTAISANPLLGFHVKNAKAGDKIAISWKDNQGERGAGEATVA